MLKRCGEHQNLVPYAAVALVDMLVPAAAAGDVEAVRNAEAAACVACSDGELDTWTITGGLCQGYARKQVRLAVGKGCARMCEDAEVVEIAASAQSDLIERSKGVGKDGLCRMFCPSWRLMLCSGSQSSGS